MFDPGYKRTVKLRNLRPQLAPFPSPALERRRIDNTLMRALELGTHHHVQGCRKTSETHTSRQVYTREMDGHKSPTQHQMMVVILALYIPPARRPVYISPLHAQMIMAVLLCRMCDRIMASQEQNKIRAPFHATRDAEKCPTYRILIQPKPKIPTQRIPEKIKNADPTRPDPI